MKKNINLVPNIKTIKKRTYLEMLSFYKDNPGINLNPKFVKKLKNVEVNLNYDFENLFISEDIINNSSNIESGNSYYSVNSIDDNEFSVNSDYSQKKKNTVLNEFKNKKHPNNKQTKKKHLKLIKKMIKIQKVIKISKRIL